MERERQIRAEKKEKAAQEAAKMKKEKKSLFKMMGMDYDDGEDNEEVCLCVRARARMWRLMFCCDTHTRTHTPKPTPSRAPTHPRTHAHTYSTQNSITPIPPYPQPTGGSSLGGCGFTAMEAKTKV